MLSRYVWTSVALEWTVEKPILDLSSYELLMNQISEQLSKLKIVIPQYSPSEENISSDYLAIYKIFQSAKGNELKVRERLNSIIKYLDEHNIQRPSSHESLDIRTEGKLNLWIQKKKIHLS